MRASKRGSVLTPAHRLPTAYRSPKASVPGRISLGGGHGVNDAVLSAHRHQAVEKVGVQGLEAGPVGLQRRGEPVLGDQEVDEEIDPARQRGVRCARTGQQGRARLRRRRRPGGGRPR